ncbi:hypothetical protein STIB_73160 [Streptomyces sp. IB2014 011-1]|nr:hypothetical protein STIB_73160 [Streptomyces sp. IB2014 011-1]
MPPALRKRLAFPVCAAATPAHLPTGSSMFILTRLVPVVSR